MNKATVILIAVIYVASIVCISLFGMRAMVFDERIPVTRVECINTTDERVTVTESNGTKVLNVRFTTVGILNEYGNAEGTYLQLYWRVYPDNASDKNVRFVYDTSLTRFEFVKDADGNDLGLILFNGPTLFTLQIMATDGTRVYDEIIISVRS